MNYLYLLLDVLSLSVPFIVSFHPRIRLDKKWAALFTAIFVAMIPYIIWDVYFTINAYWGFNPTYLTGLSILHLPIEEWLFFICIPYACVFTHESILAINPRLGVSEKTSKLITILLLIGFGIVLFFNWDKAYTLVDMIFGIVILLLAWKVQPQLLPSFYITFLFMLIPFFIVNGVLTGTGIEGNIVWYNDDQNLGIRLGTIPVEDTVYAFSLILLNLVLFKEFSKKLKRV